MGNVLTINYYSNYANILYNRTSGTTKIIELDSSKNILIHTDEFLYGDTTSDFFRDYSNKDEHDTLGMVRTGYIPTGYWNTSPDGKGMNVQEDSFYEESNAEDISEYFGHDLSKGSVMINLYAEWGKEDSLIINYYSNYADKLLNFTTDTAEIIELDSSKNILLHTDKFPSIYYESDFFRNYSGVEFSSLLMRKNGCLPTRYWNTSSDGKGIRVYESDYNTFRNSDDVATYFGHDISQGQVIINLYAEWIPLTTIEIHKDGIIYAGDYIQDSSTYIDKNGMKIHAPSFNTGDYVSLSSEGITAKEFRYGSPEYLRASYL